MITLHSVILRLDRGIPDLDAPIKSGHDIKVKKEYSSLSGLTGQSRSLRERFTIHMLMRGGFI